MTIFSWTSAATPFSRHAWSPSCEKIRVSRGCRRPTSTSTRPSLDLPPRSMPKGSSRRPLLPKGQRSSVRKSGAASSEGTSLRAWRKPSVYISSSVCVRLSGLRLTSSTLSFSGASTRRSNRRRGRWRAPSPFFPWSQLWSLPPNGSCSGACGPGGIPCGAVITFDGGLCRPWCGGCRCATFRGRRCFPSCTAFSVRRSEKTSFLRPTISLRLI